MAAVDRDLRVRAADRSRTGLIEMLALWAWTELAEACYSVIIWPRLSPVDRS